MEQEAQSMKGYHFYAMLSRMKYQSLGPYAEYTGRKYL